MPLTKIYSPSKRDGEVFLDFREMTIYLLLEALGAGPPVLFFVDAYSADSFHIVTAEVPNAIFPVKRDRRQRRGRSAGANPPDEQAQKSAQRAQQWAERHSKNKVSFLETCLVAAILGLNDCHQHNLCSGSTGPNNATLQIIDFVPPSSQARLGAPGLDRLIEWIQEYDLLPSSAFPLDEGDLKNAVDSVVTKFSEVRRRQIPIAVYPPFKDQVPHTNNQVPLADLLNFEARSQTVAGDKRKPVACSEFVLDIESQIWDIFFARPITQLDHRTLGSLFGFTDIANLWDRGRFDKAATAACEKCRDHRFHEFDEFVKELYAGMGESEGVPEPDGRNPSVNYALAQMRWFSRWVGYRFASFKKLFLPPDLDALFRL
jgi:hypothetical protein